MTQLARIEDDDAEVLTLEQVAERVKVHPRTVKRAIDSGDLEASQLNPKKGGWRIEWPAAVVAWLLVRSNRERAPRPLAEVRRIGPGAGAAERARKPRSAGTLRVTSDMGRETA